MVDTGKPGVYLFTKFDFKAVFHYICTIKLKIYDLPYIHLHSSAQLVEHCTSISEARGSNQIQDKFSFFQA